jgi:hypothetical protein
MVMGEIAQLQGNRNADLRVESREIWLRFILLGVSTRRFVTAHSAVVNQLEILMGLSGHTPISTIYRELARRGSVESQNMGNIQRIRMSE